MSTYTLETLLVDAIETAAQARGDGPLREEARAAARKVLKRIDETDRAALIAELELAAADPVP